MGPTGSSGPPGPRTHGGGPSTCGGTGQLGRKRLRHSPHPTARGDSSLEAGGSWDGTAVTGDKAPHPTRHAGRSTHGAGRGCGQVEVHQHRLGRALIGGRVCSLHTAAGTGDSCVPSRALPGPSPGPSEHEGLRAMWPVSTGDLQSQCEGGRAATRGTWDRACHPQRQATGWRSCPRSPPTPPPQSLMGPVSQRVSLERRLVQKSLPGATKPMTGLGEGCRYLGVSGATGTSL